jgi:Tfp pilus assembly protein PilP
MTTTTTIAPRSSARWRHALLAALLAAACGGDDPPPPKPKKAEAGEGGSGGAAAAKPAAAARPKKGRKGKASLVVYARIDEKYRRPLAESDFVPDPSGEERRDPFQSFVVRQGNLGQLRNNQVSMQPTDVCTEKNTKAPGYLLRDMRLIGIVLRGTTSFAQFRDAQGFGWIVSRGDCLGKEKAVVQAVGVGSVTLEVIPETPPNAPPPSPQRQDIALYPEDLDPGAAIGAYEQPPDLPTLAPAPAQPAPGSPGTAPGTAPAPAPTPAPAPPR